MQRIFCAALMLSLFSLSMVGCAKDESSTKTETEMTTPGGKTTVTNEKTVKQTGENPPPVRALKTQTVFCSRSCPIITGAFERMIHGSSK